MKPILFILAIAYWLFSKIKTAVSLDVSFDLPTQIRISNFKLLFTQPVQLINRSGTALNIRGIDMQFATEKGVGIGTAYLAGFWRVPPNGSVTLPVAVSASLARLLAAMPELRKQIRAGELVVSYRGNIRAEGFTIPVSETIFNYQLPDLF